MAAKEDTKLRATFDPDKPLIRIEYGDLVVTVRNANTVTRLEIQAVWALCALLLANGVAMAQPFTEDVIAHIANYAGEASD